VLSEMETDHLLAQGDLGDHHTDMSLVWPANSGGKKSFGEGAKKSINSWRASLSGRKIQEEELSISSA